MVELKSGRLTFTADRITLESRLDISEDEMPESLKTVSYRLSQEAMKNIAKHSKASLVGLSLRKEGERIQLTVRDNGQWADSNKIVKDSV